jgi:hypothetical protein
MAFVLLWIEALAVLLLLVATLAACVARLRRRWLRYGLAVLVMLVPLAATAGLTILAGVLRYGFFLAGTRFFPLLALTGSFLVGGLWVLRRGLRLEGDAPGGLAAASWPRGRLGIGLGVAAALAVMTFWNLDLAARQQMEALRADASALALSVAPPKIPDRDNAALVYQQAIEAMGPDAAWEDAWEERWDEWLTGKLPEFDPQDAALRDFLARRSAVLDLLHQAAKRPGCWFDRDYGRPSFELVLAELPYLRKGARLLSLDARCKAADGDIRRALEDVQATFVMAEHVAGEPITVSLIVSIAVERLAADSLQAVLASGQASEEQLAVLDVDPNASYGRHFQRCLRMEEAMMMSIVYRIGLERKPTGLYVDGKDLVRNSASPYRVFLLSEDLAGLREAMKEARFLATQPYREAEVRWDHLRRRVTLEESGLFVRVLIPGLCAVAGHVASGDARHRLALAAVAMCRYRAANGSLPDRLDDLAPRFITAVPRDPFDGEPIRLKRIEGGLVVYSVGPDMVDNGGSPLDKEGEIGDITFELVGP